MPEDDNDDDLRGDDLRGRVANLEEAYQALLLERSALTQEIHYLQMRNRTVESALAAAAALFAAAAAKGEATDADVQARPSS